MFYSRSTGAVVVRMAYGYKIKEEDDPIVKLAEATTENFALSTAPGGFMVDVLPICEYALNQASSECYTYIAAAIFPSALRSRMVPGRRFQEEG